MVAEVDARQEQEGDGADSQGVERAPGGRPRHRLRRPQRQASHPASKGTAAWGSSSFLPPFLHNKMREHLIRKGGVTNSSLVGEIGRELGVVSCRV